ncbi:malate/L-lactate dehydrogenase [Cooperia oncophora]
MSDGEPIIIKEKGATAWVDGCNLLGPVVGNFCMKLAVQKGMAFTNTSPCVFPTNSAEKSLGSNPICLAAPAANGDSFFLDMASTTVAYGKIEVVDRRGGKRIPRGWGADADGIETQDPKEVLNGGGLQPLGGAETSGGYKGTGLCMMVEVLCGIMSGSSFGKSIRKWQTTDETANLGQCFVAIDPECFAPGFCDRLSCFLDETRDLKPIDPSYPVQVAGDPERAHMCMCDELDGIVYKKSQLEHLEKLANDLGVQMFKAKKICSSLEVDSQGRIALEA